MTKLGNLWVPPVLTFLDQSPVVPVLPRRGWAIQGVEGLQPISASNRKMPASLPPGSKFGGYGMGLSRKVVGLALPYDEVVNQAMPRMMQVSGTRLACPGIRLDQLMIFKQLL